MFIHHPEICNAGWKYWKKDNTKTPEMKIEDLSEEDKLRLLTICKSGIDNPDSAMGCYAYQPGDYDEFNPFFKAALSSYHKVDLNTTKHVNNWSL
jgi:creatine kinase